METKGTFAAEISIPDRFSQAYQFAYSSQGLNMNDGDARAWAKTMVGA